MPKSQLCCVHTISCFGLPISAPACKSIAWQGSHGTGVYPSIVSFLHYRMDLDSMYARIREWLLKMTGDVKYWIKNIIMQPFKVLGVL